MLSAALNKTDKIIWIWKRRCQVQRRFTVVEKNYRLFQECEKHGGDNEQESDYVIPLERFRMEYRYCDGRENGEWNRFLDDFQLHQAEGPAVDTAADAVGGNHEAIFKER